VIARSDKKDLLDKRFGRLTVIDDAENDKHGNTRCLCRCDCGKEVIIQTSKLLRSETVSCGCYRQEIATKHGLKGTRIYHIWTGMLYRCYNEKHPNYKNYGGRGITVCDEWKNDINIFNNWALANGYQDNLTIDRIDNNGNYEPKNCRWITQSENSRKGNKTWTTKMESQQFRAT
jgi:hypothetical protein